MKVIAIYKDGTKREIAIPETEWSKPTALQALEYAKKQIPKSERFFWIKRWEVEEDFL